MAWMQRYRTFDATTVFIWMILIHLLLQPGWVHYFCWLPFVHVWCWCKAKGRPKILWLLALAIFLERLPLLFLNQVSYFAFSRAAWMTVVLAVRLCLYMLRRDLQNLILTK